MQINSINTNLAAFSAQTNIRSAQSDTTSAVARLSSGNKITQASDDVAGLSIGTSLATNVSTLRTALVNASQGISLLSVADSALNQITEILQRQKSIAVQAGSGTLGSTERAFLDAEFQALTQEIDRIASNTNFNGVNLIDGGLSSLADLTASTTNATQASATINFSGNFADGESVVIGGVAFTGTVTTSNISATNTLFEIGSNLSETLDNLAAKLESLSSNPTYSSSIGDVTFSATSNSLEVTARSGGELPSNFTINQVAAKQSVAIGDVDLTAANANVVVTLANHGYQVGQKVLITTDAGTAADNAFGTVDGDQLYGVITAVTSGTFTFANASGGNAGGAEANAAIASVQLATATYDGAIDGQFAGTTIDLFTGTAFASASTVVSANTAAAATPFQNGDSITATVNGVTKTLYTFGTASDGGAKTVQNVIDGINANKDTTGVGAQLVLQANGTYNIQLKFDSPVTNVLVDLGAAYNSTTYNLAGDRLDDTLSTTVPSEGTANAATLRSALFGTSYITAIDSADVIAVANLTTAVTIATPVADAAPFRIGDNMTVTVGGEEKILHTFAAADGLDDIIASINAKTGDTGVFATVVGTASNYNIRLYVDDPAGGIVTASTGAGLYTGGAIAANANNSTTAATAGLTRNTTVGLAGGANDGIAAGSVSVTGTIGNNVLADLGTQKANSSVILTQIPSATSTLTIAGQLFRFTATTTGAAPNEILIGSNIQETIDNAIDTLNSFVANGNATGDVAYQLSQINFSRDGNTLNIEGKGTGNVTNLAGTATTVGASITGATVTQSSLNNASTTFGVDVSGVTNADFSGTVGGFTATYTGTADTVNLSVTVGDFTYSAANVDLTVSSDTTVRLYSNDAEGQNGGYFDIQLQAGNVTSFSSQSAADAVADRLNSAFATLSFQQERNVESYTAGGSITANGASIGSLLGSSVTAQLDSFDNVELTDINVTAPNGSTTDARISLTINGVDYTSATGITDTLGANQSYTLLSADDPNQYVTFTTGDTTIDLSSESKAAAFEDALKTAFGLGDGSNAGLNFQVGTNTSDSLSISINDAGTEELYDGQSLNVLTSESAAIAVAALDVAIQNVTAVRAQVGATQSRFNFAAANIESSIQNQDAARGTLLDTDIANESTQYSIAQVKLQAGISVLAQANQQLQSLLKLIG